MDNLTCRDCGASFTRVSEPGRPRVRCFDCSPRRSPAKQPFSPRVCAECELTYMGRANSLYCSYACKWLARKARAGIPCMVCGEPTGLVRSTGRTDVTHKRCSRGPNYRESRSRRADGYVDRWNCSECGVACTRPATKGQRPKYCELCRRVRQNPLIHMRHKERLRLYERDGWVCWLCCAPVDGGLIGSKSHWRPSLDHVVPRSVGGLDEPENLRLAHWWCNSVRGDGTYHKDFFEEVERVAS